MASPYAFVTLVSSDPYLPGALAQVAALNDLHPTQQIPFHTVCLVTPESVDVSTIKILRKAFNVVVGVEILQDADDRGLKLLGRPDLTTVLTKLHVFRLTPYFKIIFLDADVLPLRPLSHLFKLPHEFSAVPDVGWPDIFNSGVLVLSPGEDKFNQLNDLLKSKGSWDGGDQGLLNEWRGGNWNRLSFTYNTTPTAAYTYAPAYERFGSQISALHFIGKNKPWNNISFRTPFSKQSSSSSDSPQQAYDYDSLVDRWYAVYDKHYRSQPVVPQSSFEFKRYSPAWDEVSSTPSVPTQLTGTLGLQELKALAIEGIAATASSHGQPAGEGQYISMPLEGRVDLMRPRKPEPKVEQQEHPSEGPHPPRHHQERHRPSLLNVEFEEGPNTPPMQSSTIYAEEGDYGWRRLHTPHPNDVPPSPHMFPVGLPQAESPHRFEPVKPDFYASESESEAKQASQERYHALAHFHLQPPPADQSKAPGDVPTPVPLAHHPLHPQDQKQHTHTQPDTQAQQQQQQQQDHQQSHGHAPPHTHFHPHHHEHDGHAHHHHHSRDEEPAKRPLSPPMLSWNAALEPPPKDTPAAFGFPADTYFPNLWDQAPPPRFQDQSDSSPQPRSINFFHAPPMPEIPQTLINQGHYRSVTGDDPLGVSPSPDRTKVKSVFPWEERPRVMPNRVFPDSDAPPPALFLSPGSPSQTSTAAPSTPEQPKATPIARMQPLSPLFGLPPTLTYANAWDTVPSIQKYASKLVRPPQPPPLAPAFDDQRWRRPRNRSWDDRLEASSRDGDDEDNADDEEDEDDLAADTKWDDSDKESTKSSPRTSRPHSVSMRPPKKGKKEYCDQSVQTIMPEMKSQGVQVEIIKEKVRKPSMSKRHSNFLLPPLTRADASGIATPVSIAAPVAERPVRHSKASLRSAGASPVVSPRARSPVRSPVREFIVSPANVNGNTIRHVPRVSTPQSKPAIRSPIPVTRSPNVSRQTSNDSSITSPASSSGGHTPLPEIQPISSPTNKTGGRVWDPARGVEIFKRGSEEVLARFLRMGNWENESVR